MHNQLLGKQGEDAAASYLVAQGYAIRERNFRTPVGEIDIIAERDKFLIFVEVKTRRSTSYGTPGQAVDFRKQRKITRTAFWYLRQSSRESRLCRFDIIEVYAHKGRSWDIVHIKSAFDTVC